MLKLKVHTTIGKAYSEEDKQRMLERAAQGEVPSHPLRIDARPLWRNAEKRNYHVEMPQFNFNKRFVRLGEPKPKGAKAGSFPLTRFCPRRCSNILSGTRRSSGRFNRSGGTSSRSGSHTQKDPTRDVSTLKTAWGNVRDDTGVTGRFHDNRHTLITELTESGAGDQTIMDIAGHVSKQMLKHYSQIRMEGKRNALESIVKKPTAAGDSIQQNEGSPQSLQKGRRAQNPNQAKATRAGSARVTKKPRKQYAESPMITHHFKGKSLHSGNFEDFRNA
jgi:integrase